MMLTLVNHGGELKPFGRLRAMQMLLEKAEAEVVEAPERSPYAHELNSEGTACVDDCPACQWVREKQQANLKPL